MLNSLICQFQSGSLLVYGQDQIAASWLPKLERAMPILYSQNKLDVSERLRAELVTSARIAAQSRLGFDWVQTAASCSLAELIPHWPERQLAIRAVDGLQAEAHRAIVVIDKQVVAEQFDTDSDDVPLSARIYAARKEGAGYESESLSDEPSDGMCDTSVDWLHASDPQAARMGLGLGRLHVQRSGKSFGWTRCSKSLVEAGEVPTLEGALASSRKWCKQCYASLPEEFKELFA